MVGGVGIEEGGRGRGLRTLTWNCLMAGRRHLLAAITCTFMIWMEWARARWRAPMSRSVEGGGGDFIDKLTRKHRRKQQDSCDTD